MSDHNGKNSLKNSSILIQILMTSIFNGDFLSKDTSLVVY